MRSKFLSVIVSFLLVTISFTACLNSNEYEYSSDATVHAFGLDTIYGKHYKFTIDQVKRLIYNADSLPVTVRTDSLLKRILIDTFSVTGYISSAGGIKDTAVNISDSVNLIPAIREIKDGTETGGMLFNIIAADGTTRRQYELQIRVHRQDPDSMVWTNMQSPLDAENIVTRQKAVILNGTRLLVYLSATQLMEANTESAAIVWNRKTATGLPDNIKLNSLMNAGETLYIATENGELYSSTDGENWTRTGGEASVVTTVAYFQQRLIAVLQGEDGQPYFAASTDGTTWTAGESVPDNFPLDNIYATQMTTNNNIPKVIVTGNATPTGSATIPWSSMDGLSWASLYSSAYCPYMENPFIMYYGDTYYLTGGNYTGIYSSVVGLAWEKVKRKMLLPVAMSYSKYVSVAIDKNDYVWMITGQNTTIDMSGETPVAVAKPGTVWRGRLNRLGFDRQ
ncbi:MAG: DUF6242 domain-containing protein [Prevotellaceae bacterium]|jgi:hypothetical protein|nr:DUF6242 domain-containing protein [Prevotellaceae bacterium]